MRVAIDIGGAISSPSGLRRYTEQLIQGLAEVDSSNEYLLYAAFWNDYPDAIEQLTLPKQKNFRLLLRRIPQRFVLPAEQRLGWAIQENWLRTHQIDVFHGTGNILPLLKRTPAVLTFHHVGGMPDEDSSWNRFYFGELAQRSCRAADKIIAVSEHTRQELAKQYGIDSGKISVVWEGGPSPEMTEVDPNSGGLPPGLAKKYILFVSAVNARKNLLTLLRAYAQLVQYKKFDQHLLLVGRREASFHELSAEVARLKLGRRVRFLERVSQQELFAIYRNADLFVYPSLMEGFGLPLLEAMACSVPVIAANAAASPEVAGNAALYFDGTNETDLFEKMQRVLTDEPLRQDLIAKGRARAMMFDWKQTAIKTLDIYRSTAKLRVSGDSR